MINLQHKHEGVTYELTPTSEDLCDGCAWTKVGNCTRPLSVPSCIIKWGGYYVWVKKAIV